jgi:hypothetical protein
MSNPDFYQRMLEAKRRKKALAEQAARLEQQPGQSGMEIQPRGVGADAPLPRTQMELAMDILRGQLSTPPRPNQSRHHRTGIPRH